MGLSRKQRRANIRRALSRVRKARAARRAGGGGGGGTGGGGGGVRSGRATFTDVSGQTVSLLLNGKTVAQVIKQRNDKVIKTAQTSEARKKLGAIIRVFERSTRKVIRGRIVDDPSKKEIVYVGTGGRKVVFDEGVFRTTAFEKPGGRITRETARQRAAERLAQRVRKNIILSLSQKIERKELAKIAGLTARQKQEATARASLVAKKVAGLIEERKIQKGITKIPARLAERIAIEREKLISLTEREKGTTKAILAGVVGLGGLGVTGAVVGAARAFLRPDIFITQLAIAILNPRETAIELDRQFRRNPSGVITEFIVFRRTFGAISRGIKNSPVGRTIALELFIRKFPKNIQNVVRTILKGANAQKKINPNKVPTLKDLKFAQPKSLTAIEFKAALKAMNETPNTVLFGSGAGRLFARRKIPKPEDLDIASGNVKLFIRNFVKNLPKKAKKDIIVKGEKVFNRNRPKPLFDIKPLSRLIQQRGIFTRRGRLPVIGFRRQIKGIERLRLIRKVSNDVFTAEGKVIKGQKIKMPTRRQRSLIRKNTIELARLRKRLKKLTKGFKASQLVKLVKRPFSGAFEFATQKIQKVKGTGIQMVGFGEQTLRKALGTLQVLVEKEIRRQKDPQGLLMGLEVQVASLVKRKPKTAIGRVLIKRRIRIIKETIKLLKSKAFARLLEKKVPGLTKQFPLVSRINLRALKQLRPEVAKLEARKIVRKGRFMERLLPETELVKRIKKRNIFFHGTTINNLKNILKKGLKTKKSNVGFVDKAIFLASNLKTAKFFGRVKSKKAIVLKIRLTKKQLRKADVNRQETIVFENINPKQISLLRKPTREPTRRPAIPRTISRTELKKLAQKLPKQTRRALRSRLPSRLPSKIPVASLLSRLPSRLRRSVLSKLKPSRVPSRVPSRMPSRVPSRMPSKVPPSRPPTRVPPSRVPPSRPPTRVPPSRVPPSRPPTRVPPSRVPPSRPPPSKPPPSKPPLIPPLTWKSKLPKGYRPLVTVLYKRKGRIRKSRIRTTVNRSLKKITHFIDNSAARSFQLKIVGMTKQSDIGKVSMHKFRLKRSKDPTVLMFVEKSKYAIDSPTEKRQIRRKKRK